jgi:hypothetical protein
MALYTKIPYLVFVFFCHVTTAIVPIYSLSTAAQAIASYLPAHKARCDKQ